MEGEKPSKRTRPLDIDQPFSSNADAGANPARPTDCDVSHIDDGEPTCLTGPVALDVDHQRASLGHFFDPFLDKSGSADSLFGRFFDITAGHIT